MMPSKFRSLSKDKSFAQDPLKMAVAMKSATSAGRLAYLAGRIPKRLYATASSPEEGNIAASTLPK